MPSKKGTNSMRQRANGKMRTDVLRHQLLERRQQVLREVDGLLARRRSAEAEQRDDVVPDAGDLAVQDSNGDQQIALMEIKNRMREQIDEALRRLDEGTYGVCEDCSREINEARLQAIPFARRCLECQQKAEFREELEQRKDRQAI
jgi:RNA polymerase-binding transcription factor